MGGQHENPPAFPQDSGTTAGVRGGMTLRDWFAGQAIDVVVRQISREPAFSKDPERSLALAAKGAYIIADAMLAARTGAPA